MVTSGNAAKYMELKTDPCGVHSVNGRRHVLGSLQWTGVEKTEYIYLDLTVSCNGVLHWHGFCVCKHFCHNLKT